MSAQLERGLKAVRRLQAIQEARDDLLAYQRLLMPDPQDIDDVRLSQYIVTPQARLLADIIHKVERRELTRVAVSIGPQFGKALEVSTPVPTPNGWARMDELRPGDAVFDEAGRVCRVVAVSPIWRDRPVYEVRADDGFSVVADAEHEWVVRLSSTLRPDGRAVFSKRTTAFLAGRAAKRNPLLSLHGALDTPQVDLPVDPYVLGVWLGDGCSSQGTICAPGADGAFIEAEFNRREYTTRRRSDPKNFGVMGLQRALKALGVFKNKHIPGAYLRASADQRLDLLRGLVDTDGHAPPKGPIEIVSVQPTLVAGIRELVVSLGAKCQVYEKRAMLNGRDCGPKWSVCFYMAGAALLPRKRERCRDMARCRARYLTFRPAGTADTVCIEVDAPSHQFLCGRGMMPTCNSQLLSRAAPAWLSGRNPQLNAILGSYNQDFANEFGDDVRAIVTSSAHKQVFPEYGLRRGGAAKDLLITDQGGKLAFVGVGGSGTGKPADIFVVDDPIRNDDDAQSEAYRNRMWQWFTRVANTRIHNDSAIIVVHTRWSEDDLIGRLCDPDHPERHKAYAGVADEWTYINLPAVVDDPDLAAALSLTLHVPSDPLIVQQFGSKPMASLWPERFSLSFLAKQKRLDKRGFEALRMGRPSPEDGDYFREATLVEYHSAADLPKNLRMYGASDHAVSTKQRADSTVVGCIGVDADDHIWVMPDLIWEKMETPETVEALLSQFAAHKPLLWWMESELISKSFGPFLRKRMMEERTYVTIEPVTVASDKMTRARAIQGRLSMKMVHFPAFAPWWSAAKNQMLKFPYGTHDDFVDWLAHIGLGLNREVAAERPAAASVKMPTPGTIGWTLGQTRAKERVEKQRRSRAGW